MCRLRVLAFFTLILFPILTPQVALAQKFKLEGQVVEPTTPPRGIAALGVKLTPSKELSEPQRITSTDQNGQFQFNDLTRGRYMLEVRQGLTLLHREILSIEGDTKKQVTLRRQ
jgi:hypothetical protein